jgi:hypothetical protein
MSNYERQEARRSPSLFSRFFELSKGSLRRKVYAIDHITLLTITNNFHPGYLDRISLKIIELKQNKADDHN